MMLFKLIILLDHTHSKRQPLQKNDQAMACVKVVFWNEWSSKIINLNNIIDTGGLVFYHPGISSHSADYTVTCLQFKG